MPTCVQVSKTDVDRDVPIRVVELDTDELVSKFWGKLDADREALDEHEMKQYTLLELMGGGVPETCHSVYLSDDEGYAAMFMAKTLLGTEKIDGVQHLLFYTPHLEKDITSVPMQIVIMHISWADYTEDVFDTVYLFGHSMTFINKTLDN